MKTLKCFGPCGREFNAKDRAKYFPNTSAKMMYVCIDCREAIKSEAESKVYKKKAHDWVTINKSSADSVKAKIQATNCTRSIARRKACDDLQVKRDLEKSNDEIGI
jgi:hypothetical protein